MTRVRPQATPNWWLQVKSDHPWTRCCVQPKIVDDGKRHRCHKAEKHHDIVPACKCRMERKQFDEHILPVAR